MTQVTIWPCNRRYLADVLKQIRMSIITNIIVGIIVLHLIVGFGWVMYKLAPRKKDDAE